MANTFKGMQSENAVLNYVIQFLTDSTQLDATLPRLQGSFKKLHTEMQKLMNTGKITGNILGSPQLVYNLKKGLYEMIVPFEMANGKIRKFKFDIEATKISLSKVMDTDKIAKPKMSYFDQMYKIGLRALETVPMWMAVRTIIQTTFRVINDGIRTYVDYEREMGRVATVTLTMGATQKQFNTLYKAGMDYMARSSATLKDTASAMYQFGSAGLKTTEIMAGLESAMNLSIGTAIDAEQAAKTLASAYRVFGDNLDLVGTKTQKFNQIADTLTTVFNREQVEMDEITTAFGYVANAASTVNINFRTLVGTIGFLNTGMLKGSKAGTSLMNSFADIAKHRKELENLTGKAFDPNKPIDFLEVMSALQQKLQDGTFTWETYTKLAEVFNERGRKAVMTIIKQWDKYNEAIDLSADKVRGMAAANREVMENNVPRQLDKLKNLWRNTMLEMAKGPLDLLLPALKLVNSYFEEIYRRRLEAKINVPVENDLTKGFKAALEAGLNALGINNPLTKLFGDKIREELGTSITHFTMSQDTYEFLRTLPITELQSFVELLENQNEEIVKAKEVSNEAAKVYYKYSDALKEAAEKGEDYVPILEEAIGVLEKHGKGAFTGGPYDLVRQALEKLAAQIREVTEARKKAQEQFGQPLLSDDDLKRYSSRLKALGFNEIEILRTQIKERRKNYPIEGEFEKSEEGKKLIDEIRNAQIRFDIEQDILNNLTRQQGIAEAMGASEIETAQMAVKFWEQRQKTADDALKLEQAQYEFVLAKLKELGKYRDILKNSISGEFGNILKGQGGSFKNIAKTFKDTMSEAFSESATDKLFDMTGLGNMFGSISMRMKYAFQGGASLTYQAIVSGFRDGTSVANGGTAMSFLGAGGGGWTGIGLGLGQFGVGSGKRQYGPQTKWGSRFTTAGQAASLAAITAMGFQGGGGKGDMIGGLLGGGGALAMGAAGLPMMGASMAGFLGPVGIALMVGSMIYGMTKKTKQEIEKTETKQVASKIDVTNKQLEWVNRNLVALKSSIETFMLPESYYFRTKETVEDNFSLTSRRGLA